MASGDTIDGDVYVVRRDVSDNEMKVVGRLNSTADLDTVSSDTPQGKVFVNTNLSDLVNRPNGARPISAPNATFESGEEILIKVDFNEGTANALDVDGDQGALNLGYIEQDLNRGITNTQTFTLADNEITSDPSVSAGDTVTWFRDTVGDSRKVYLAGLYEAAPSEA